MEWERNVQQKEEIRIPNIAFQRGKPRFYTKGLRTNPALQQTKKQQTND